MHSRARPVSHRFQYPIYYYAFDLAQLHDLDREIHFFGYNRIRPVAIHDTDYLLPEPGSIRQKLDRILSMSGDRGEVSHVTMVTAARYFHYVFNPVSFFYCYRSDGSLHCVIAQVNNTFGEMHVYLLRENLAPRPGYVGHYRADKAFHVSPFFDRKGSYEFFFSDIRENRLDIIIHYYQDRNLVFTARLEGTAVLLSTRSLVRTLVRHPLAAALTMPRILWQAARLYFQKRLPVFHKPPPSSPMTVRRAPPGLMGKLGRKVFFAFLSNMKKGSLSLTLPEGGEKTVGIPGTGARAEMTLLDNAFFRRTLRNGGIGFGESYTAGEWTTPDLTAVLTVLAGNLPVLKERGHWPSAASRLVEYIRHQLRSNTIRQSARNISKHYDLGNEFFALFLDPTMTYSCGLFETGKEGLEEAQVRKMRSIMDLTRIDSSHHVLEIGCGWGSFAVEAAGSRGCRVTGITTSREQLELAREKVHEAGLCDLVTLEMRDYRHIEGTYDRIVSIEMLEAVGHSNLGGFFSICERSLKPAGRAVIQVITLPDDRYDSYRRSSDWIRKHIFSGGHLPSVGVMKKAISRHTDLDLVDIRDIGRHYAITLNLWRENLLRERARIHDLGFDDEFLRKWEYYFSYCEAGFLTGAIQDHQLVLVKGLQ